MYTPKRTIRDDPAPDWFFRFCDALEFVARLLRSRRFAQR
jgi:hypothetical protein